MIQNDRNLVEIINNEALDYALYTVQNRAIPSLMDGFKPSQRFVVCRCLDLAKGNKDKFHKLASVAGGVADLGYHHGEVSAQEAGALMASDWKNNFPILDGDGNFGSRLVQEAAASRYVFCRISDNFRKVYKDIEIAPKHEDAEHIPPKFYLPIIPTVLLNGVKGVATGYSTSILPHSFESVVECTLLALQDKLDKEPIVKFPKFNGNIVPQEDGGYVLEGTYSFAKGTKTKLDITEIPYKWDRAKYVEKVLDPLEDSGKISYDDNCSKKGFGFKVTLKKDLLTGLMTDDAKKHAKIMNEFKLTEKVSQNIVVINEDGKLLEFEKASDLIKYFVKVRLSYIDKRIVYMVEKTEAKFKLALAKARFINDVIKGDIVVSGKTKKQLTDELATTQYKDYVTELLALNVYHITSDEAKKLALMAKEAKDELEYWKNTTSIIEYTNDLEALIN